MAPWAASRRAVARPMPEEAPTMRMFLFVKVKTAKREVSVQTTGPVKQGFTVKPNASAAIVPESRKTMPRYIGLKPTSRLTFA
ncbi:hypothetical protein GCM10023185_18460 [Hymenobacter saemangeumensis]|uniref:Uncharacterized protein n=1 Tax=Hymenobacter saemangeumensis TaxID=1084522 RepID=A0ABP8IBV6_9BACT